MRKAFNFFNSYWQTANELSDKDRLAFYDALLYYQFTGDKSKLEVLTGMAKFAFISQSHSIDSQVKGYIDKCKDLKINAFIMSSYTPTEPPAIPPTKGATEPPAGQGKGKGEVQGKGKVQYVYPSYDEICSFFIENGYSKELADKFYTHYQPDWKDSNNKLVKDWKKKAKVVWFKESNKTNNGSNKPKMVY